MLESKMLIINEHLPKFIADLQKLNSECLSYFKKSQYQKDDLRKTIFAKFALLFTNLGIHADLLLKKEPIIDLVKQHWSLYRLDGEELEVNATHCENFLKFTLRSVYSESIEIVEHLIASILENKQPEPKQNYVPFRNMIKDKFFYDILDQDEQTFLSNWAQNDRNPRHRNYKGSTYAFPHCFDKFHTLLKIILKITLHPKIQVIDYVKDDLPR